MRCLRAVAGGGLAGAWWWLAVALLAVPAVARPDPGLAPPNAGSELLAVAPEVPASARGRHAWPVPGALVAPFDPPAAPWGPGHRGVDLAVAPGERVRAMADGVVGFAGVVAGRAWVSIDHADDLRTTAGPLAVVAVEPGREVDQGQVVGTAAATAHAGAAEPRTGRLHVSARVGGRYVDPTLLVGPWIATLVPPPDGPPPATHPPRPA